METDWISCSFILYLEMLKKLGLIIFVFSKGKLCQIQSIETLFFIIMMKTKKCLLNMHRFLSSKYSYNKNCTIPYFTILISNRANFVVCGSSSLTAWNCWNIWYYWAPKSQKRMDCYCIWNEHWNLPRKISVKGNFVANEIWWNILGLFTHCHSWR